MELKANERIDDLEYNDLKIIQNEKGFCFGIDSVLISDFARDIRNNSIGVDLGTGTGIISILLTSKTNLSKIIGIEVQKDVADMAKRSIELNKLQDKIEIINMNIKDILNNKEYNGKIINNTVIKNKDVKKLLGNSFDFIVTNPPYKKLETGKVNENEYKYISRHEITATLEDFLQVSKYLLKDKGSLYMVHRPDRLVDIIAIMRKYKLEPKKIRFVHSMVNKEPSLVLIKAVKNANVFLKIEKPLFIYDKIGQYSDEIYKIYGKRRK